MIPAQCADQCIHVSQGDWFVTTDANLMLTTILGSCVAACMYDPVARVGGMNHFLLPKAEYQNASCEEERNAVHLMELLVNGLMQRGARRERLEVKLFGGARLMGGLSDVGAHNADFAERFIRAEGIRYVGGSLRGTKARRIQYWPISGRARQTYVTDAHVVAPKVPRLSPPPAKSGDVELF
jgi:chemotaxis protein CheD